MFAVSQDSLWAEKVQLHIIGDFISWVKFAFFAYFFPYLTFGLDLPLNQITCRNHIADT